jgi:hypothetical protein
VSNYFEVKRINIPATYPMKNKTSLLIGSYPK